MKPNTQSSGLSLYGLCANTSAAKKHKEFARNLLVLLMRGLVAPAEILLRTRFGERYFDGSVLIGNILVLIGFAFLLPSYLSPYLSVIFLMLFLGMLYHSFVCFLRDRKGEYWHSYYEGTSRYRLRVLERFLERYHFFGDSAKLLIEPLVIFLWSILILFTVPMEHFKSGQLSELPEWAKCILVISRFYGMASIGLFFYQCMVWKTKKLALLDAKDAQVAAQNAFTDETASRGTRVEASKQNLVQPIATAKTDWSA